MDTDDLLRALRGVRDEAIRLEHRLAPRIEAVPADQRQSARNLVHYLAMRRLDLRDVQRRAGLTGHRGRGVSSR